MVYVWLCVIIISLVIEASTASLVAIWFIPSAIVSAVTAKLGLAVAWQIIIFFILSIILIVCLRRLIPHRYTPTNADALVGQRGIVTDAIDELGFQGIVKVKGQIWSAKGENSLPIPAGEAVEVVAIEGVKLVVKKIN